MKQTTITEPKAPSQEPRTPSRSFDPQQQEQLGAAPSDTYEPEDEKAAPQACPGLAGTSVAPVMPGHVQPGHELREWERDGTGRERDGTQTGGRLESPTPSSARSRPSWQRQRAVRRRGFVAAWSWRGGGQ